MTKTSAEYYSQWESTKFSSSVFLTLWFMDLWGLLRLSQEVYKIQAIFIIILGHYLPFSLYWHLHKWCTKAMVDKIAGNLVQTKAVASECTSSHCIHILHCHTLIGGKKKKTVSLKNILDGGNRKIIIFMKSQPWGHFKNYSMWWMGSMHKTFLLHTNGFSHNRARKVQTRFQIPYCN